CEPCPMCLGAIYWARPQRVFYAGRRNDAANAGFDDNFIYRELGKNVDNRSIPMISMGRELALDLFERWNRKEDKIEY
ncbi:MAG: tRNA-specific adenosine deaminase, partial [Balneolaceae bacterium]